MSLSSSMRNEHQTDGDYRTSENGRDTQSEFIPSSLFRIHHRAAGPVSFGHLDQRGEDAAALGYAESAAGLEGTARGHGMQGRDGSFDSVQGTSTLRLQVGNGVQQTARIGMCRGLKDFMPGGEFHHPAGIHHSHAISNLRNHG